MGTSFNRSRWRIIASIGGFLVSATCALLSIANVSGEVVASFEVPDRERASLIASARLQTRSDAAVAEIRGYDREGYSALVVFEPYAWTDSTFMMDVVQCRRIERGSWRCEMANTSRFAPFGSASKSVRIAESVDLGLDLIQRLVTYTLNTSCPAIRGASEDFSFYNIWFGSTLGSASRGNGYLLDAGSCALVLGTRGDEITIVETLPGSLE
jgi:hypothetical protein